MSEKLRAAAQQALTALENATIPIDSIQMEAENAAIAALRSVLEEPEPVQELVRAPYCHVYEYDGAFGLHREFYPREYNGNKPDRTVLLFTHPREPLTVQEPVEPVAWRYKGDPWLDGDRWHDKFEVTTDKRVAKLRDKSAQPLYAAPPQRGLLTDEEIDALKGEVWGSSGIAPRSASAFARAVERKVRGEKE